MKLYISKLENVVENAFNKLMANTKLETCKKAMEIKPEYVSLN